MPNKTPIAAVVLTLNEEGSLPGCLDSLADWIEQVIVVDSGSMDKTLKIARRYGAQIVQHPFENYGTQRNWAMESLSIETPWVLHIDADERVTPELRASIERAMAEDDPGVTGYLVSRRTMFMGRWIRHGGHYPVWHLRLFRTGHGRCENRLYDQHFVADGPVRKLEGDLIDTLTADIPTFVHRHVRWAELEADEQETGEEMKGRIRGKLISGNPIEGRRWLREWYGNLPIFVRPVLYFLYRYVFRLGFLDGREGLIFHLLHGFWYRFLVDVLVFERRRMDTRGPQIASRPAAASASGTHPDRSALLSGLSSRIPR